jgi:hypothetical protein
LIHEGSVHPAQQPLVSHMNNEKLARQDFNYQTQVNQNTEALNDVYNRQMNFIPQSQNDILYWLFTDTQPNGVQQSSPDWSSFVQNDLQQTHGAQKQPQPQPQQVTQQAFPHNHQPIPQQIHQSMPQPQHQNHQRQGSQISITNQQVMLPQHTPPANGVQFNPTQHRGLQSEHRLSEDKIQTPFRVPQSNPIPTQNQFGNPQQPPPAQILSFNNHQILDSPNANHFVPSPNGGSQISSYGEQAVNGQITPFPQFGSSFPTSNAYGFQDVNIFFNDDNPLDDVFLRNYRQVSKQENDSNSNFNISLPPTLSSHSPISNNESVKSPKSEGTSLSSGIFDSIVPKIIKHAEKFNLPIHNEYFVDASILDQSLKAMDFDRVIVNDFFCEDKEFPFTLEDRLSYYLYLYWEIFHPQFTVLHRPSFDTKTVEPLLLLSMMLIGCSYSYPSNNEVLVKQKKKSPEFKFSVAIATPLRYKIFENDDFRSPTKLWVLQSLNLLEWCEKNFLLRRMHERAHVHHGTNVQLLRRSPLLGGNPATTTRKPTSSGTITSSTGEEDSDSNTNEIDTDKDNSDKELFEKWVDSESMKRITFLTFYLDIMDYVKFRHNPQILFCQLQLLSLPCDDEQLWESVKVNGSFKKVVKGQKKIQQQLGISQGNKKKEPSHLKYGESFLSALKKLLKPNPNGNLDKQTTSLFTKNILLAGLMSVVYQMQQTELQSSSFLSTINAISQSTMKNRIWKDHVTKAIDYWYSNTMEHGYTTKFSVEVVGPKPTISAMYQLCQIIGISDINHYDIAIYGGSPANMSVNASMKDVYIIQRKLATMWAKAPSEKSVSNLINYRSVIHCYWLLWQLMLKPTDDIVSGSCQFINWNVNNDYFDTMYAVGIATLVLWCYVHSICGTESNTFGDLEEPRALELMNELEYDGLVQLSAEDGFQYLSRVHQEFVTNLRKINLHNDYNIHPLRTDGKKLLNCKLTKYCEILPHITNKQNISGLCFLVGTKLLESQWEIIRENAKLIINCGLRSIGKKAILCENLFDNEFED